MPLPQTQFQLGADHSLGHHPANAGGFQVFVLAGVGVVELGAHPGEADLLAGGDVGRTADDLHLLRAGVNAAEGEAVGVGMLLHGEDQADTAAGPAAVLDYVPGFDARHGEPVGQLGGREVNVNVLF